MSERNWTYYNGALVGKKCAGKCGEVLNGAVVRFSFSNTDFFHMHCALDWATSKLRANQHVDYGDYGHGHSLLGYNNILKALRKP